VPTYEYQCDACGREFEVKQRISEAPLATCEVCGGNVRRLLSPAPFILKGEGWYVTDYPSESRKKARESEENSKKPAAAAAGSGDTAKASDGAKSGDSGAKPGDSGSKSADAAKPAASTATPSSD
jgi:putative FmdB family regulatory protein